MKKTAAIVLGCLLMSTLFGCASEEREGLENIEENGLEQYDSIEISSSSNDDVVTYDSMREGMVLSIEQIKNAIQGLEYYEIYAVKLEQDKFQIINIGGTSWNMNEEQPDIFICDGFTSVYKDDCLVQFSSSDPASTIHYISYENQWIAPFLFGTCTDGTYQVEPFLTASIIDNTFVSGDMIPIDEMYDTYAIDNISTMDGEALGFQDLIEFETGYYLMDVYPNQYMYMGYFEGTSYFEGEYSTAALIQIDRNGENYYSGEVGNPTRDGYYEIGNVTDIISYYPETEYLYVSLSGVAVNDIALKIHCNEYRDQDSLYETTYEIELNSVHDLFPDEKCEYDIPEWYKNGEITFSDDTIINYGYTVLNDFAGQRILMYKFKDDIMTDIVEYTIWESPEVALEDYEFSKEMENQIGWECAMSQNVVECRYRNIDDWFACDFKRGPYNFQEVLGYLSNYQ